VEQHLPAAAFDVLAFNLSAELVYTNLVNMIDLAGLPLHGWTAAVLMRWSLPVATASTTRAPGRFRRCLRPR